jgi:4-hydroxy 2-oxovalerate aldolase
MKPVKIIDVTLRDGGYRNNFEFSAEYASHAIGALADIGVQYAEIGYCNGPFLRQAGQGPHGAVDATCIEALVKAANGRLPLCVMVHPRNVDRSDLTRLVEHGISMIRVCLRPEQLDAGLQTIALAHALGVRVSANFTHVTEQPTRQICTMAQRAEGAGAQLVCLADSNGHLLPDDVSRLLGHVARNVEVPLGLHAHNNLSLALANAMAAIEAGAQYIDASVCGMGKGAGNLHLSMLIGYLHRCNPQDRHDLVKALQLSQYTAECVAHSSLPAPLAEVMLGAYNLPFDSHSKLVEHSAEGVPGNAFEALRALHERRLQARESRVATVQGSAS